MKQQYQLVPSPCCSRGPAFPSLCSDSWDVAGRLCVCQGRDWQRPRVWSEKLFLSSQLSPREEHRCGSNIGD